MKKESNIEIKRIDSSLVQELNQLARQTFTETFAHTTSAENLAMFLDEYYQDDIFIRELADPESLTFFAYCEGDIAGYLKINWGSAQTEPHSNDYLEIQRLYVLNRFHGRKIGATLMQHALDEAHARSMKKVWLGVWEYNFKAQKFYHAFGFHEVGAHSFPVGEDPQVDLIYERDL